MRIAVATLESISPYSTSKHYEVPKLSRPTGSVTESHHDYEERTWRERCNVTEDGHIVIPPMAFKKCLSEIARRNSVQIPGKGKRTYTKHFVSGILVLEGLVLPEMKATVSGDWIFVPSDGIRGSGKRVLKCFPVIPKWSGQVTFHVLDDVITQDVFEQHLKEAGNFIGVGRFRPINDGFYGRFTVKGIEWS
jgi:hypothetical protein